MEGFRESARGYLATMAEGTGLRARYGTSLLACYSLLCVSWGGCRQNSLSDAGLRYPETYRDPSVVDDYHGHLIADAYRWLEDDTSASTRDWVKSQNAVTQAYLASLPDREAIRRRVRRLYDYERVGVPDVVGTYLYYTRNDGLQDQPVLYREPAEGGVAEVVLDPNTFSADNTSSLAAYSFDADGRYLAYQVSDAGSDWRTARVMDLADLSILGDTLADLKFTRISWAGDGFFYSRYPPDARSHGKRQSTGQRVYYHQLGATQAEDRLVYATPERPQRNNTAAATRDGRYVVLTSSEGTSGNALAVARHVGGGHFGEVVTPVDDFAHDYYFEGDDGRRLLFRTNADAPNGRLVAFDPKRPGAGFTDVLGEDPDRPLKSVTVSGDRIYARYLSDVASRLEVYSLAGEPVGEIAVPGLGTATAVEAAPDGGPAYFLYSSLTRRGTVFRYEPETGDTEVWRSGDNGFDAGRYVTEQLRYRSKDGTVIPMFVTHRRGLALDGQRPTLLYGYGGFDISIEPKHAVMRLDLVSPILEQGGVVAVANLRGGGEYGAAWHEAGIKERKQNVFDDFIAAAEYLHAEGYTNPARTAIYGRSNGGLLVGACLTQRPELFGVAFPAVGVLDMLRYHRFTIGYAWASDYGHSDSAAAFDYLRAYSPLHNVRPATYPATMVTTADHDDRVVPAHSFKFAAELQHRQRGEAPVLIRVDEASGHGAGKPVAKQIEETTDVLAFMFHEMGIDYVPADQNGAR